MGLLPRALPLNAAWFFLFTQEEKLSTGINSDPNLNGISHPTGA